MRPFWDAAREGRFVLQRCRSCRAWHFPAIETCSRCLAANTLEWETASGRGVVLSYVVMHQVYHPGFAAEAPYRVIDVRLEEGPRMISRFADDVKIEPRVGMPVTVAFARASDEVSLPVLRPAEETTNR
jgi:uncharacterized OB-fold protein